ncbi:lyase family protein [Paeniroseomonas aquatica]
MLERLDQLRPRVEKLQFGGAAGTLASLGDQGLAVQDALAKELGLASPDIPWHVARDGIAEAVGFLGLLCGALSKIATDVILMMQTEVAEVAEPHQEGRGGSSTMPQKRNPISCEYIIAQSRGVHALVPQMLAAMAQDQERGTGPWQTEPLAVGQAFLLAHGALAQARVLAEGLTVDVARMQRNLDSTGGLIVAEQVMMGLAPALGRGGPSRRQPRLRPGPAAGRAVGPGPDGRPAGLGTSLGRRGGAADRPFRLSRQHPGLHRPGAGAAGLTLDDRRDAADPGTGSAW